MAASNYVIRDMVHYVHDESEYRFRRTITGTLRQLLRKMWVFLIIIVFAGGTGYLAVFVVDDLATNEKTESSGFGPSQGGGAFMDKFGDLSDDQKRELMRRLGGQ